MRERYPHLVTMDLREFGGPNSLRWGDCNNPQFYGSWMKRNEDIFWSQIRIYFDMKGVTYIIYIKVLYIFNIYILYIYGFYKINIYEYEYIFI